MAPQVYALKLFCVLSYISFLVNSIYKGGEGGERAGNRPKCIGIFFSGENRRFFFSLEKGMICISPTKGGWVLSNKGLTVYPLTTEDGMNVPLVLILIWEKYFSLFFFSFINQAKISSTEVTEFGFQGLNGHFQMMCVLKPSSFLLYGKGKSYS